MVGISSFVVYNVYQRRFFINYFLLLRRRKLLEKRDPKLGYTYDVFISYSQVLIFVIQFVSAFLQYMTNIKKDLESILPIFVFFVFYFAVKL
jgi:hypothetical protein